MAAKKKQQVTIDEAVATKPTEFEKQLAEATGATEKKEKEERAAALFNAPAPELPAEVLPLKLVDLKPSPRNPRSSLGDLTELIASIEKARVLSPVLVRELDVGEGYEIISGHRRHAAAMKAGLDTVPCIVVDVTELQALELNLTEQLQRAELTPLEEGEACRKLQELSGYSVEQVAAKLGRSPAWVRGRLALCNLAPEAKKQLKAGDMNVTVAAAIAALPTAKMQAEAVEKLEEEREDYGGASTNDEALEFLREKFCKPLKGVAWKLTDADLVPEAGACSACPKNSSNNRVPGLFDNVKAPPTCADVACFDRKAAAVWAVKTAKYKQDGAKILPASESLKLFQHHNELGYGCRYVEAKATANEDSKKRSWKTLAELLKAEQRPQLHIAQDKEGGVRELYVKDKLLETLAEEFGWKWAKKAADGGGSSSTGNSEWEKQQAERRRMEAIIGEVKVAIATRIAVKGIDALTLPIIRAMVGDDTYELMDYLKARGSPETDDKAAQKFLKTSPADELLGFLFFVTARFHAYDGFQDNFKQLATEEGFDLKAMLKAKVDGEKSEAAIDEKKKTKGKAA